MKWLYFLLAIGCVIFAEENSQQKTLNESIKQQCDYLLLSRPYQVAVLFSLENTPNSKYQENIFRQKLEDQISYEYQGFYASSYYATSVLTNIALKATHIDDIPEKFLKAIKQEIVVAIEVSHYDRTIQMRSFSIKTKRFTPIIKINISEWEHLFSDIIKTLPKLLAVEGFIIQHNDTYKVVFRGKPHHLQKYIASQDFFFVSRNYKKITDSYVIVERVFSEKTFLCADIDVIGEYRVRGSEGVHSIYFTGGKQKIKIVNNDGQPQQGFSIYTNYESFGNETKHYLLTTDISGSFLIEDVKKAPVYLTVMKNIENVNFPIVEKHIIVEDNGPLIEIVAQKLDSIEFNRKNLSQKDIIEIRNQVINRILQANNFIKNKEYDKGIIALKYAKKIVKNVKKRDELKKTLRKLEKVYQEAIKQQRLNEAKKTSIELLKIADEKAQKLKYREALEKIKIAKVKWPVRSSQNQGYKEILNREERLQILIIEENTVVGEARIFLSKKIFTLKEEEITFPNLEEINSYVKILKQRLQDQKIYSDRYILLGIAPFLDKLSSAFIAIADIHLANYKSNETEAGRREAHQKYENYINLSKKTDSILQELQKI